MADIAQIGFKADTSDLKAAKATLDALPPSASRAEASAGKLSATLAKVDATADKLAAAATGLISAVDKMNGALDRSAGAANVAAVAQGKLATSSANISVTFNAVTTASIGATTAINTQGVAAASTSAEMTQLDAHVAAYRANLRQLKIDAMATGASMQQQDAHMVAYRNHLDKIGNSAKDSGTSLKFTAREGLNFSRQLSDIGVTAAMGMNPLMIALQQGPQLFDIIQEKAISSGTSISAVFRAAGATILAALLPLLPVILGIAAVVGTIAAAFALGTREINKGNQSVIEGMGLTEKQLERVKKAGVDTGVTIGDTFKAFFQVIGSRLKDAFEGPLSWLSNAWSSTLDFITKYGTKAIEFIIGAFIGAVYAIKAGWRILPSALGDIVYSAANITIAGVEFMINKSIDGLNKLVGFANAAAEKVGLSGLGTIGNVSFGRVDNPYAGQAKALGGAIAEGVSQGLKEGKGVVGRFLSDVAGKARENARARIRAAAGDPEKGAGAKTPKGPKSDAAKFEDIVKGAEADIATQTARAKASELGAEAAAKFEYQTKLLNEAQSKGIALTDGMRSKIEELAGAYAKAKVAADNAVALRDVLKAADGDIANLKAQADMIGLYGRQLAYATQMQKLLNDAKAKGMTPDAIAAARPQFESRANQFADASASNANRQFMEAQRVAAEERTRSLFAEKAAIGLSADETNRLRIENELLAAARAANIELTPADIAALGHIATAQAAVENTIRKTREAMAFAKDVTKGFINDLRGGLEQGKSIWESFGNAVLGVLNKIADKLLDKGINSLIDNLFKSSGSGGGSGIANALTSLFSAKGNVFGSSGVSAFANGASFTNSVVNAPTPFAFGRGGSNLGIMGEAGPEAVMPLQRGPDGSLGVQMYGGSASRASAATNLNVEIHNNTTLTGAISSADIVAAQKAQAERTKQELRREIPAILQKYQNDGTVL